MTRISVVTGASGGIGGQWSASWLSAATRWRCSRAARTGWSGAAEDVRRAGGTPLPIEVDMADFAAVDEAAERVEKELGPIELWVNDAFSSVFAPFTEIGMDEFTRITQVSYLGYVYGHAGGAVPDAAPRPRDDRAGRLRAGVPRHPAADRLLRRQARDQGFHESLRVELLQ
jgi:NAD(P)-dependent dehydrogenase (short-subunit alcohol dehydrogenase family)